MDAHNLVVFWRDQQARCFTAWHFQPSSGERASQRAQKILSVLTQLSGLQIYGAALDDIVLRFDPDNVVPPFGTETRLEVSLTPTIKGEVGGGQIRFSIPGPTASLSQIVAAKQFSSLEWQLLEQEIISYLCSPKWVKVSISPAHLQKAEIAHLDSLHRPQPGQAPIDSALDRTEEALQAARRQFQQQQTQKLLDRVEKYQQRLNLLQRWKEMEAKLFSQVQSHLAPQVSHLPLIIAKTIAVSPTTSTNKEVAMTEQNVSSQSLLLPKAPPQQEAALWEDVPQDHFSMPQMWTHRSQLRSDHGLNERTYYRWLRELGLKRSLPAEGNARVALFYRPDVAKALALFDSQPHRAQIDKTTGAASKTTAELALASSQLSSLVNMVSDLAAQQKAFNTALSRLEARLTEQRQADLNQIGEQINELARKQDEISLRLPQGHLLDLMAQLVNLNQLPAAIRKLNSNVKKLAEPKAKATKVKATKVKAATKAKGKKKRAKSK
jgi:hypothetical protein